MREGFLYIYASTKFGIESETHPLTIRDKQPNQVGFIPLYIPANIQYR